MTRWLVGAYGADMDGSAPGIVTLRSRPDGSLEPDETIARPLASPSFGQRRPGSSLSGPF